MKKMWIVLTGLMLALVAGTGCGQGPVKPRISQQPLPEKIGTATDSTSLGDLGWKEFIGDSLLIQLIETALTYNPDVQAAWQRMDIARTGIQSAKGDLLPQISASINGGVRKFGLYTMDGAGNIVTEITPGQIVPIDLPDMFVGFQASWEVDIWGKLRKQKKAALSQYLASVEGKNTVLTAWVADISKAYYELLALDVELDIIRATQEQQQAALDILVLQKETGRATELAIQQFTAQLLNTRSMEVEILQKIKEHENLINFLCGRYPQEIKRNPAGLSRESIFNKQPGLPAGLLSRRPDIRQAELELASRQFQVEAARAAFYPRLALTPGIGFQAFDPAYLFLTPASIAYNAIGNLTAPLVNRNAIRAQFNRSNAQMTEALCAYQQTILNAFREVVNEMNRIENLGKIRKFKEEQKTILNRSVETSRDLYKSGRATYLEILLAQQNALQAQLEVVEIRCRQRVAEVNLYRSLGGGWK